MEVEMELSGEAAAAWLAVEAAAADACVVSGLPWNFSFPLSHQLL